MSETFAWEMDNEPPDDVDDEDDVNTCEVCGETDAMAPVKMPLGGGMTETMMMCQFCGHIEDDES